MAKDSELLERAAQFISTPQEWCQGRGMVKSADGELESVCAESAIDMAFRLEYGGRSPWRKQAIYDQRERIYDALISQINELCPEMRRFLLLRQYNDHPHMDHSTMYAAMIKATNKALEMGE